MRTLTFAIAFSLFWADGAAVAATPDKLIPDDAHVVVSINLRALQATEFMQKYGKDWLQNLIDDDPVTAAAAQQIGLDPARDLDAILIAARELGLPTVNGGPLGLPLPTAGDSVTILRGRFDAERGQHLLADLAKDNPETIKESTYENWKIYEFKLGDRPMASTFLTKDTFVVATSRRYVTDVIDRHLGNKKSELDAGLAAAIGRVDDKCLAWAALGVPGWLKDVLAIVPAALKHVEKLNGVTMEAWSDKTLAIDLNVRMRDNLAAEGFRKPVNVARFVFGALLLPNERVGPTLFEALAHAKAVVKNDTVNLHLEITPEMMARAARRANGPKTR